MGDEIERRRVFISHSPEDAEAARQVESTLDGLGLSTWRPQASTYAGQKWPEIIGEAISNNDLLLLLWSRNASNSRYVEFHWSTALALHKRILPCLLDDTPLAPSLLSIKGVGMDQLGDSLPLILSRTQAEPPVSQQEVGTVLARLSQIAPSDDDTMATEATMIATQHIAAPTGNDATVVSPPQPTGDDATVVSPPQPTGKTGISDDPAAPQLGRRYDVIKLLGQGGMGAVYKVYDRELNREVALKLVKAEMAENPTILERFKREVHLSSIVTHPNVLRVYDLGEGEGIKFLTMQFVDGEDLTRLMQREGPLELERMLNIFLQVCEGLKAAHDKGILHRDLKPANIMIDREGQVYLTDFGLARSDEGTALTQVGELMGTPHYMSPEQVKGEELDLRSDIYALGVILYEMATGKQPYSGNSIYEVMIQRTQKAPESAVSVNPNIPSFLEHIIRRCMAREKEARYSDLGELLEDLREGMDTGKTLFSSRFLLRRITRMRKRVVIALGALLMALLIGVVLWPTFRDRPAGGVVEPTTSMAVLPFQNASGDPALQWLGAGLAQMLATEVGQFAQVRVTPPDRVHQVLSDLRVPDNQNFDAATRRRVADFCSAEVVVWGKFVRLGEQIRVDATLQDFKGGRTLPLKAAAPREEELLEAVSALAKAVRDGLELQPSAGRQEILALKPSTESVEALRQFNEGLALAREGNDLEALSKFEAATEADENFALAFSRAAQTQRNLGYASEAARLSRQAIDLSGDLPARERLEIEAVNAQIVGDWDKATEVYRQLLEVAPSDVSIQMQLAELYEARGSYDLARRHYGKVLEADPKYLDALYAAGRVEIRSGNYDKSLEFLNTALTLAVQLGNRQARASALQAVGIAYKNLDQPEEALRHYEDSLRLREEIGDRRGVASSYSEIGAVNRSLGQLDEAAENYRKALEIQREIGDRSGISITLNSLSSLEQAQGRVEEALELAREALQIQIDLGNEKYQSTFLSNIGSLYYLLGRYDDSLIYHQRALQLREKIGIPADMAVSLYNIAETYTMVGQLDEAQDTYLRALELWRDQGDETGIGFASFGMGQIFEQQGRHGAALAARKEALEALSGLDETEVWRVEAVAGYGRSLSTLGRSEEADAQLAEAMSLARTLGNDALVAKILKYGGDNDLFQGDSRSARRQYREALEAAGRADDSLLSLVTRLALSRTDSDRGSAVRDLRKVHQEATAQGLKYQAVMAALALGQALLETNNQAEAQRWLEQALQAAERMGLREVQARCHGALAELSSRLEDDRAVQRHKRQVTGLIAEMEKEAGGEGALSGRTDLMQLLE